VLPDSFCPELQNLERLVIKTLSDVKRIRRSRDISFFEDADLNRLKHEVVTALIKHLLAGHQGQPCPAGSRPIVSDRYSPPREIQQPQPLLARAVGALWSAGMIWPNGVRTKIFGRTAELAPPLPAESSSEHASPVAG
jgi:hypothetical protein